MFFFFLPSSLFYISVSFITHYFFLFLFSPLLCHYSFPREIQYDNLEEKRKKIMVLFFFFLPFFSFFSSFPFNPSSNVIFSLYIKKGKYDIKRGKERKMISLCFFFFFFLLLSFFLIFFS